MQVDEVFGHAPVAMRLVSGLGPALRAIANLITKEDFIYRHARFGATGHLLSLLCFIDTRSV
jgi:hypothetical protein